MRKRTACWASAVIVALGAVSAQSAQAKFVAVFEEVGANVEEIGDGTIDVTDLGPPGRPGKDTPLVSPIQGIAVMGALDRSVTPFFNVEITGPGHFGFGATTDADGGSGDRLVIAKVSSVIGVPSGYISGAKLNNSLFYLNATFASLGMTPGVYVWSWGSGAHADSLTIDIAVPAPGVSLGAVPDP